MRWDEYFRKRSKKGFNTQPPEGGWTYGFITGYNYIVSTHSRPKAAGWWRLISETYLRRFNTQPPEGGWSGHPKAKPRGARFQHTAARRRLVQMHRTKMENLYVSTHSRPKAAGCDAASVRVERRSFNTQPPEGGWIDDFVSCTKRPCFNTQPPEGGWLLHLPYSFGCQRFQHTAARRRLAINSQVRQVVSSVSTHSRPKAAGFRKRPRQPISRCFNTQPPEGGWIGSRNALPKN